MKLLKSGNMYYSGKGCIGFTLSVYPLMDIKYLAGQLQKDTLSDDRCKFYTQVLKAIVKDL